MSGDNYRSIVAFSVEVVLMRVGGSEYQTVLSHLERDQNVKISDCFDNPEGLKSVLREIYGKKYFDIINNIELELGEVASNQEIINFLNILKK